LKLAKKYEFHVLRDRIIEHLKSEWPDTMAEWDLYQEELKMIKASPKGVDYENGPWLEPVSAIHIGREFNCPFLVLAAFYLLSTFRHNCKGARWDLMEHRDWIVLLRGQQTIWTNSFFASEVEGEADDDLCGSKCRRILELASRNNDAYFAVPSDCFSFALAVYNRKTLRLGGMCDECIPIVMKIARNLRRDKWNEINDWFKLSFDNGGWNP
jgi:hypothetical protein